MIVNMPTDAEVAEAKASLAAAKEALKKYNAGNNF
jgi:hypothetical protein